MTTRLIGDVHGKYGRYRTILKESPHPTIQVGDMGVGFLKWPHGTPSVNPPYDLMVEKDARFIRGNHDNPGACERHTQWIQDGNIESGVMFVGGAVSIDKAYRVPDFSWWPDEELSSEALHELVDVYITSKPRIMVTHECPEDVAQIIAWDAHRVSKLDPRFASRTRVAFQHMWSSHSPDLWVFGHWHHSFDRVMNGTRFICLAELEYKDFDL